MYNQINVQHIKNYFRKPSTLVLSITLAITVVISFIIGLFTINAVNDLLRTFASLSHDADLYELSSISVASSLPSTIISSVVSLIPAGLWLWVFLSSRSNNINEKPDTAFTVNFVFAILGIVSSALLIVFSGLVFIMGFGFSLPYDDMTYSEQEMLSSIGVILIILSFVLLFVAIITLIYNIAKTKFFSSIKKSMVSDRMYPSGTVYGTFSFIKAIFTLLISIGTIIFGFILYNSNDFTTDINNLSDILPILGISKDICVIIIIAGFAGFITVFSLILEGIIAFGYNKMAKTVPPTPGFNPYNNPYNQYNQFNQNQYNPNYNNGQYNNYNQNYNNNFNNQNFNQPYPNNQGYNNQSFVNQQPIPNEQATVPNEPNNNYNDGFDELNQHLDNQINNDNNLHTNPYENQ